MPGDDEKKLRRQTIAKYRAAVGSGKKNVLIDITDKEWEAIQNHAISYSKMNDVLNNTDMDKVKQRALPRNNGATVPASKISRMKSLINNGYPISEVADMMSISPSTVRKYVKGASEAE